jgi:hypothetical protein
MEKTQAKLRAITSQGSGIEALSSVFGTEPAAPVDNDSDSDGDMTDAPEPKKSMADVKVAKKKSVRSASKKYAKVYVAGQTGAHNARLKISKSNKRGQTKRGFSSGKKTGSGTKKKSSKKMAKF